MTPSLIVWDHLTQSILWLVKRQIGLGCVLRVFYFIFGMSYFILGMGYFMLGVSNFILDGVVRRQIRLGFILSNFILGSFILDGVVRRQIGLGCVWQLDAICAALLHCGDGDTICTNVSHIYTFKFPTPWPCPARNAPGKLIKTCGVRGVKIYCLFPTRDLMPSVIRPNTFSHASSSTLYPCQQVAGS